jgi:hypothetical protein
LPELWGLAGSAGCLPGAKNVIWWQGRLAVACGRLGGVCGAAGKVTRPVPGAGCAQEDRDDAARPRGLTGLRGWAVDA